MKHSKMFLCEACTVVFQVHTPIRTRKPYCVNCGDDMEVVSYRAERQQKLKRGEKIRRIRWTDEELALIEKCNRGELTPHQVAIQIGRSINSVTKKAARVRKEVVQSSSSK